MFRDIFFILVILCFASFLSPHTASSEKRADMGALENITVMKAYFDIKADKIEKLEKQLGWIHDIHKQMSEKGIKTTFIIGFRSNASYFVTKGDEYVYEEDLAAKEKIENRLKQFVKLGMRLEQCGLSAELFEIDPQKFLSEITVVKNGYISMIGYQNKGYAYVPM